MYLNKSQILGPNTARNRKLWGPNHSLASSGCFDVHPRPGEHTNDLLPKPSTRRDILSLDAQILHRVRQLVAGDSAIPQHLP